MRRFSISASALLLVTSTLACSPSTPPASSPADVPASNGAAGAPATPVATGSEAPATGAPTPSKAGPAGAMCGGIAGFGCATGLYCAFPLEAHCGAADQSGVCKPIAEMCTEQFDPVCGCNDKTYPNECYAAREGISVGAKGACANSASAAPAPNANASANANTNAKAKASDAATANAAGRIEGQVCGSRAMEPCQVGLYCKFGPDCGDSDRPGKCTKIPNMCTKIYRPVCGCDGKAYGNDCSAASAGVAVRYEGQCKEK